MATDLERTAYHEAGHFVASRELALDDSIELSIVPDPHALTAGHVLSLGLVRYIDPKLEPPVDRICAYVISLVAGFVAQRRFDPGESEEDARAAAETDFSKARGWSVFIGLEEARGQAEELIEREWNKVSLVARALLVRKKLTEHEAELVLGFDAYRAGAVWLAEQYGWTEAEIAAVREVS